MHCVLDSKGYSLEDFSYEVMLTPWTLSLLLFSSGKKLFNFTKLHYLKLVARYVSSSFFPPNYMLVLSFIIVSSSISPLVQIIE